MLSEAGAALDEDDADPAVDEHEVDDALEDSVVSLMAAAVLEDEPGEVVVVAAVVDFAGQLVTYGPQLVTVEYSV